VPLDEYARKRSFDRTPEPAPALAPVEGRRFCVQRHSARRLHYDLRMEIGGALKSWAVPEGPTLDPTIKRLAVNVEDHPIEYAHFEGNIPKGNYGAGSMMLWDIGTFTVLDGKTADEQLERGDFKFRLHGKKLAGDFALIRLKNSAKQNEWLLIKKPDAAAKPGWTDEDWAYSVATGRTQEQIAMEAPSRYTAVAPEAMHAAPATGALRAAMPGYFTPMLSVSADSPPVGQEWLYEIKWDGVRVLAFLDSGKLSLRARKGMALERTYPDLAQLPEWVAAESAILDGEIVALDPAGRPSFQLLQPRIMATPANAVTYARTRPASYFAFDLLYLNGWDLRPSPLCERRRLLELSLKANPSLKYSAEYAVPPRELLAAVQAQGLEGIVGKRRLSRYESTRSNDWVKIKVVSEQEFVIAGYQLGERDYFASLVLGVYDQGRFICVGSVGTGFDNKLMASIHALLAERETTRCPFDPVPKLLGPARWVKPELVCRVRFSSWTEDLKLRAPVFGGLRTDIDPAECVREGAPAARARTPLVTGDREDPTVTIEGHTLRFTHVNKVYFPASDRNKEPYYKRDVINYYDAVAELLIPHWLDRPLNLKRYPDGIGTEAFFQKNAAQGFPEWMRSGRLIDVDGEEKVQVIGAGKAELLYLAQLGCIDQNPWMSRMDTLDHPDFMLIDLDPYECGYDKIVEAALLVRRRLELLGLTGYPKTTGGDGMHIYVPLEPIYTYEQSRSVAEVLARLVAAERPDLFTMPRSVSKREKGRVYFDYLQNSRGKTISAPYVVRAYPGAPVATPLDWRELSSSLHPSQFHIRNAMERFDRVGELYAGVLDHKQRLEPALAKLEEMVTAAVPPKVKGAGA
jgi:bifunctional non-homologous end joining protein LigD